MWENTRVMRAILEEKIRTRAARVGIVGLGYVGLPLAVEFARAGFSVTGIDVSQEKARRVNAGDSYVGDVPNATLGPLVESGKLRATSDFSAVADLDTINICVPTPLRKTKDPDMSYIVSACQEIAGHFHAGMLIILESTTYPGTTDELVLPMLSKSGLEVGRDFFLCFSPERVDPGNPKFQTVNIPKVVGGCTPACTAMGELFYSQALERVVPVSSTQVAEMVKLLENTDALRRPQRFEQLLEACVCDYHGRLGWEDKPTPANDVFLRALDAIRSVDAATIAKSCADPARIPERMHAARVAAVKQALRLALAAHESNEKGTLVKLG